jgi:hypothetical protein
VAASNQHAVIVPPPTSATTGTNEALRDIRGPVPLPPELLWLWIAVGAALGGLIAVLIWNKWFRHAPAKPAGRSAAPARQAPPR